MSWKSFQVQLMITRVFGFRIMTLPEPSVTKDHTRMSQIMSLAKTGPNDRVDLQMSSLWKYTSMSRV